MWTFFVYKSREAFYKIRYNKLFQKKGIFKNLVFLDKSQKLWDNILKKQ